MSTRLGDVVFEEASEAAVLALPLLLAAPGRLQCRVQGSGFRVQGSEFSVQGSGFGVQGAGFRAFMIQRYAVRGKGIQG